MRLRIAYIFALSIAAHLVVTSADQALRQIAVQRLGWGIADSFCWTMLGFCWGAAAGASLAKRLQTRLAVGEVCIGATFWRLAIVVMLWVLLTSPYPWEFADWMLALLAVGLAASACLVFWWRLFAESLSMRTQHHYRATAALAGAVALAALAGSVTGPFCSSCRAGAIFPFSPGPMCWLCFCTFRWPDDPGGYRTRCPDGTSKMRSADAKSNVDDGKWPRSYAGASWPGCSWQRSAIAIGSIHAGSWQMWHYSESGRGWAGLTWGSVFALPHAFVLGHGIPGAS